MHISYQEYYIGYRNGYYVAIYIKGWNTRKNDETDQKQQLLEQRIAEGLRFLADADHQACGRAGDVQQRGAEAGQPDHPGQVISLIEKHAHLVS